ncbi:MAG TPA: beta-ketoacyl-ACP synthase III [Polyangiaceae bacterium]|nr:beta-ketoacyl-ACP synthase III [Polyangiaceae bacterium]
MIRASILGLGSYVPDRVVTNDEIRFLNDKHERQAEPQTETNHEWIKTRTGIEERRYVDNDGKTACSDLALQAAKRALADANVDPKEIDCIILGTLSPDIHFPGTAVFLQSKLGIDGEGGCPCFDIRQQCSGFVYGLQMADAFVRTGLYKKILLVGSELHSHSLDYTTRGRDVMVLFGDGAGAAVIGPKETDDPKDGILHTHCQADGSGAMDLYLKVFEIAHVPYVWYDANDRDQNQIKYPQMNGKKVFLNAVRCMVLSVKRALEETGLTWADIDWFVPHQANLRINEAVVQYAEIPPEKVLNTIQFYGNTTAATVPLTIDHHRKAGRVKKGDRILSTVFGSGYTWGSAIFRL